MQVEHKSSGVRALFTDSLALAAQAATLLAAKNPDTAVIRVLRVTANRSYHDCVRRIAKESAPKNLFTLWIRENVVVCGTFDKPFDPERDTLEQLLESTPFDRARHFRTFTNARTTLAPENSAAIGRARGKTGAKVAATKKEIIRFLQNRAPEKFRSKHKLNGSLAHVAKRNTKPGLIAIVSALKHEHGITMDSARD